MHEPGPEEVFVVSGVFNDGVREYPAGSFIHAPAATSHVAQSRTGCVLFLFYPEGLRARRLRPRERDDG